MASESENAARIDKLEKRLELLEEFSSYFATQTKEALEVIERVMRMNIDRRFLRELSNE